MYWFLQQDGAGEHITNGVREWLNKTFHGRVISRMMEHPWPAKSPDLSPLDYWFWNVAMAELRRAPPRNIGELKTTVNAFAESLDYADVEKCVRHIRDRARAALLSNLANNFKERMNYDWDKSKVL